MRGLLGIPAAILTTAFCWGTYGTILFWGAQAMHNMSRLRPFICLGIAYFVLAVVLPIVYLKTAGEKGGWTPKGIWWSFIAGCLGATGALGLILATTFGGRGSVFYVMPLVFGGAPVINTVTTMFMTRNFKVSPAFLAGLILVIAGAACVLIFKPQISEVTTVQTTAVAETVTTQTVPEKSISDWVRIIGAISMTVLCWGAYGPILHKGQLAMLGSRMRPFICVGWAYVTVGIIMPLLLIPLISAENSATAYWSTTGTLWSLLGGALGAIGALGIIMAFTLGGKPVFVMPLVFGLAPIVNTFFGFATEKGTIGAINPMFYSGLIMAIIGAAMVLIFAPKSQPIPIKKSGSMSASIGAATGAVVGAAVTGAISATGAAVNAVMKNPAEKTDGKVDGKPDSASDSNVATNSTTPPSPS